jgi:lipid II:glycine glycyltransferase (peptidoglycan interpeptide bridge formation enzyme)
MLRDFKINKYPEMKSFNEFVDNHPLASVHQIGYMTEVYQRAINCDPLILAVTNKSNDIIGTCLAINYSQKSGVLKSMSTHTSIRGGPIVDDSRDGIEVCKFLFKEYEKLRKKTLYTRIYPLKHNESVIKSLEMNNYEYEGFLNFLINLDRSSDNIWSDLHKGRRKNINRAQNRFKLQAYELKNKNEIPKFYELLKETHNNVAIPLEDISLFYAIFDILVPKKLAKFIFAKKDEKFIACRLVLTYNEDIYDFYAGAERDSLSFYPNDFLVWHILKWGTENGYKSFDFGGAGKPDEEYPVRTFKERFGGNLINFGRYTKVHSPLKLKVATKGYQAIRKMKKRNN